MKKRLLAVALAVCVCVLTLSFSVSAYDDVPAVSIQFTGRGTPGLIDGYVPTNYVLGPSEEYIQNLYKMYIVRPQKNTYVQFCLGFDADYSEDNPAIYYNVDNLINTDEWVVVHRQFF